MFNQRRTISTPISFSTASCATPASSESYSSILDLASTQTKQRDTPHLHVFRSINPTQLKVVNASIVPGVGFIAGRTNTITNTFNLQARAYIDTLSTEQAKLAQSNNAFLDKVHSANPNPTTRDVRNYGDWGTAKKLVVRDELMKIQIGGKTDLPITDAQYADLVQKLDGLDLSNMNDPKINAIINDILHPNERIYMDALKAFKTSGKESNLFQASKLDQLRKYLDNIDLDKITRDEFKEIVENYIERLEIHHRTSVSSAPAQQSNIDNLDTVNTTQHDAKHTDPETGKVNYKRKTNEVPIDRKGELAAMNRRRVFRKTLTGLGISVAIGLGTGFAIGFVVSLAQNGINPNSMKYAFVAGARQGGASAGMAASGFLIGKTIGTVAGESLTKIVISLVGKNATEQTLKKISEACNTGAVGVLVTIAFTVYEFAKLKCAGYTAKECLLRAGKSAALSISILVISMVAVWAGVPGIVVSIVAGVVMTGYSVIKIRHDKRVSKDITFYSIKLCCPILQAV